MTDKEKLDKLVAEIERRYKEQNTLHTSYSCGRNDEDAELLSFYNSMQKEPKECMYSKDNYTDEDRKVFCEDCKEKCAYAIAGVISTNAQVKKEPVSDDLEGEINRYLSTWSTSKDNGIVFCEKMARHFAAWQKEQMIAKAVDGEVGYWNLRGLSINTDLPRSVSEGDKVKIIVIKED